MKIYEGNEPFVFISYSHKDTSYMKKLCELFEKKGVRFWYDDGLHSGDDWNLVIAKHLISASVCLLILSKEASNSQYIKNELIFALNHRIPIHTVLMENFEIPIDIEMMISRIQMVSFGVEDFDEKLLKAFPSELFVVCDESQKANYRLFEHPVYKLGDEFANRQGTTFYLGTHKNLKYDVLIQEDSIVNNGIDSIESQVKIVSALSHPAFPRIYDVAINVSKMFTVTEYHREVFLDDYLNEHTLNEKKILEWIVSVVDAIEYLFSKNLGINELSRGSVVVTNDERISIFRLQNMYYGVVKLQQENRHYYFEKAANEIAVLLYQLCTGKVPVLPLHIIEKNSLSNNFLKKANLVIQKCTKENHRICYNSFEEIKNDLLKNRIDFKDYLFLKRRKNKLDEYESIKSTFNDNLFTGNETVNLKHESLEEKFGFEPTAILLNNETEAPSIRLIVCSTSQSLEFSKSDIIIGRSSECDMELTQPSISRFHAKISKISENEFSLEDMGSSNGVYIGPDYKRLDVGERAIIKSGEHFILASIEFQIL